MTNTELREMLITARADAYDAYRRTREEMLVNPDIPMEALAMLTKERNYVWGEFTKRINAVPVDTE